MTSKPEVESNPLLRRVYALDGDREKTRRVYAEWAERYDDNTLDGMGYVAPALVAETLSRLVEPDRHVLDAGCGTGLVGAELKKRHFERIDGIDLSNEMLEVAREKRAYRDLSRADLTRSLDMEDDHYDATLSAGVFTSGHVKPDALDELVRVTRPGAPVVITVHEQVWEPDGYADHLADMEARGIARVDSVEEAPYHRKEGYDCRLCIIEAA